jgi:nucleoside phosphorylase
MIEEPCLKYEDYTVGLVCALSKEMTAARYMLDEKHRDLPQPSSDHNAYSLGRIGLHNVVIACLPKGKIGIAPAATVAAQMSCTFTSIRFGLMVGIGGGVPCEKHDIRLGDVVVSTPTDQHGGVIQWDMGKTTKGGRFERTGALNQPPTVLITALSKLESTNKMEGSKVSKYLSDIVAISPELSSDFTLQTSIDDVLFEAEYDHVDNNDTCSNCDVNRIVTRSPRDVVTIHYGLIASGNQVMKHGVKRDEISRELGGVLCFEMEAAGLMNEFPCIIIRGICDYADSHKNKRWQEYAAATAAAFAKELLNSIPANQVLSTRTADEVISEGKFVFIVLAAFAPLYKKNPFWD